MTTGASDETEITDQWTVTVPTIVRHHLDVEPGDEIEWHVADDGSVTVDVVNERYGAFDDFEAVSLGGDAVESHDHLGVDEERRDAN